MADINLATIKGRLGDDPKMNRTQNGQAVANFSVATSDTVGDKEYTAWHKVVAWGDLARTVADAKKGAAVLVTGPIKTRSWEDKEGKKNYVTEIVADSIRLFTRSEAPKPKTQATADDGIPLDELPF